MLSLLRREIHKATSSSWTLPITLVVFPLLAFLSTPPAHTLQIRSASWLSLWLICVLRAGHSRPWQARVGRSSAYAAGILLALGHVAERTAGQSNVDWVKVLLPFILHILDRSTLWTSQEHPARLSLLGLLTCSGLICTYHIAGRNPATSLGLVYAAVLPVALRLIDVATSETASLEPNGSVIYSTGNLLRQPQKLRSADLSVLRDVALAAGLFCLPLAIVWEPWRSNGLSYNRIFGDLFGKWWLLGQPILRIIIACFGGAAQMIADGAMVHLTQKQGYASVALLLSAGSVVSQVVINFALFRLWFAAIFAVTLSAIHRENSRTKLLGAVLASSILLLVVTSWWNRPLNEPPRAMHSTPSTLIPQIDAGTALQLGDNRHPIEHLLATEQPKWTEKVRKQSKTLDAAVHEYHRRYGLWPPPHFDKWYEYAVSRDIKMIDEYDTIYHSLLPFWGLEPALIRARLQEAIGNRDNKLIAFLIRGKKAVHIEGGRSWQQQASIGMIERFVEHLPDMDIALNVHDEPRVILPHDGLTRLVSKGLEAIAATAQTPTKYFSPRPADMSNGERVEEVKTSRFNTFSHQHAWGPSKISCPPESPARIYDEAFAVDNITAYALSDVEFIYNQSAFSDICNSPSFATSHGFFERPNAFSVVHDLFPIFSQSKMSSYQDILYPSPWYWYEKVRYSDSNDMSWEQKKDALYWRGTTTGGFTRDGGWRKQHRQRIVRQLNANDQAMVINGSTIETVDRESYNDLIDVQFTKVGQCDPLDCKAQKEFFNLAPKAAQNDAWLYRYLLDLDGNAFSGRFYAFLQSRSLVFKMAVFREWHEDWIAPWVHYIPLSLRGTEMLEAVRWFSQEPLGQQEARRVAEQSSVWAASSLRDDDLEAYFFRLLLEYARVVDDNRQNIGYA